MGSAASASTVAYYRFEEGSDGTQVSTSTVDGIGSSVVRDYGDGTNGLLAYNAKVSPNYSNTTLASTPFGNAMAMQFDDRDELYTRKGASSWIAGSFTDFTIEAYVNFSTLKGFQTFVGRDDSGNPGQGPGPKALFYLQKDGDNHFRVELVSNTNSFVQVNSSFAAHPDTWYHVAAVGNATQGTLELFVDGVSVGSTTGYTGLYHPAQDTIWSIGRGQFEGKVSDFTDGYIDEVRFSDVALDTSEFLNANTASKRVSIPEPSTYALLFGATALAWVAFRRRKA